jgi:four helix bundle protein
MQDLLLLLNIFLMLIKDFTDILAWQKAQAFAVTAITTLGGNDDITLKYEIIKAALSVPSAIAAGFERRSQGEFKEFLYLAKSKSAEVRTLLLVAKDIQEIDQSTCDDLVSQVEDVSKLFMDLLRHLSTKRKKPQKLWRSCCGFYLIFFLHLE